MAVVAPDRLDDFMEVIDKWDVEAAVIGEVNASGRLTIDHFGERIVDVDPRTVAHEGPAYERPYTRPAWQDDLNDDSSARLPRPDTAAELAEQVLAVVADPNQAPAAWVTDQYDRFVRGSTALAQPDDAGVIRVDEETCRGVAIATDANGRFTKLDPATGAAQALAESYRNVCTVGARPLAVTDCLNVGSPEDPDAMWQLVEIITGLADACAAMGVPVTGGNVSLYNSHGRVKGLPDSSINPTPVVGALGGARRQGQEEMVRAVARALAEEGHLLVQAGTGTGKSLGYLVPAMRWAVDEGARVIVSTATLALQRQIVDHDAPRVAEAVRRACGRLPVVALLKGWNNYVCLRKVAGGYPEEDSLLSRAAGEYGASATGEEVVRLREWAMSTDTGDRDDLVPGVGDRAWAQVSIARRDCIGRKCPVRDSCFPVSARQAAEDADLVVTNHSMLGLQAASTPVLPEARAIVVDEAHELAARATSQLTVELSYADVSSLVRLLRRESIAATELETAGRGLGDVLDALGEGRLTSLPGELTDALLLLLGELQQAREDVNGLGGADADSAAARNVARNRVDSMADVVDRLLSDAVAAGRTVPWIVRDREERSRLRAAPLDVSSSLADSLFEGRPAVLTSATLKIGGSFDHVAAQAGFSYPSQGPWRGLDVGSPFDHSRQAILYVPADLPPPGRDGIGAEHLDEMLGLMQASRGGALALFTSRKAAEAAGEYVRERTDLPVYCQGDDQIPTLVRMFAADDAACLFGTISLWQGVDVPGRTCRLVVIDRIPFPRPNEPLTQARTEAVAAAGGNGFMRVAASHAALLLAQGAGRLLRTVTDRGVVAVLDSRLRTARYGSFLLASLPPMWRTTDGQTVRGALARLSQADE
mgnify:CR=1 FL=1